MYKTVHTMIYVLLTMLFFPQMWIKDPFIIVHKKRIKGFLIFSLVIKYLIVWLYFNLISLPWTFKESSCMSVTNNTYRINS